MSAYRFEGSTKGLHGVFPGDTTEVMEGIAHHPQEEAPGETLDRKAYRTESTVRPRSRMSRCKRRISRRSASVSM